MINRSIMPNMPPQAYNTFAILAPVDSHWVRATCAEIECPNYTYGWMVILEDVMDADGKLSHTIRTSGRKYTIIRDKDKTTYVFEAGQPCLKAFTHKRKLEKEDVFLRVGGDFRGNPLQEPLRAYDRPDQWVDDFATHQDKLHTAIKRG